MGDHDCERFENGMVNRFRRYKKFKIADFWGLIIDDKGIPIL